MISPDSCVRISVLLLECQFQWNDSLNRATGDGSQEPVILKDTPEISHMQV